MSERGIIHGNIKPSNILINDAGNACLSDFDRSFLQGHPAPAGDLSRYCSPEQARGSSEVGSASDIFSFGTVCWHIINLQRPFNEEDDCVVILWIGQGEKEVVKSPCPFVIQDLITACWSDSPEKRPTARNVCKILKNYLQKSRKKESKYYGNYLPKNEDQMRLTGGSLNNAACEFVSHKVFIVHALGDKAKQTYCKKLITNNEKKIINSIMRSSETDVRR